MFSRALLSVPEFFAFLRLLRVSARTRASGDDDGSLVDPASSHMLVSKIKPCMSQCKPSRTVKPRKAH